MRCRVTSRQAARLHENGDQRGTGTTACATLVCAWCARPRRGMSSTVKPPLLIACPLLQSRDEGSNSQIVVQFSRACLPGGADGDTRRRVSKPGRATQLRIISAIIARTPTIH